MDLKLKLKECAKGLYVIKAKGDLDVATSSLLKESVCKLINRGVEKILLNFKDLRYVDSVGIGVLIEGLSKVKFKYKEEGMIVLISPPRGVKMMLELGGFIKYFAIFDTEEDAVKASKIIYSEKDNLYKEK